MTKSRLSASGPVTAYRAFTPVPTGLLQRRCACGGTPGPTGECAECRRKRELGQAIPLQPKLVINQPGDRYEQEANRIADQVMRMPDPQLQNKGLLQRQTVPEEDEEALLLTEPLLQRQAESEEEEKEALQTKPAGPRAASANGAASAPPIVHEVLSGSGQPLDASTRAFMEPRFGHDFSKVRVHTDSKASASARVVGARAYTVGTKIAFRAGQYAPSSAAGRRLLAHELTHVVQQRGFAQSPHHSTIRSFSPNISRKDSQPSLQRVPCSLKHVVNECNKASSSCKKVEKECKKRFPKPTDINRQVRKGKKAAIKMAKKLPNASANMLHFLGNTGSEKVMPTALFSKHQATKDALKKHRTKFLQGAQKRLSSGVLKPGGQVEMVWTDTASAFSLFSEDDLGLSVGGYTLCSKVKVNAAKVGPKKYKVSFVDWIVQAFDCYNWDPGKGIGLPGASDTEMCCIENAGKGKHFRIRTDPWSNNDPGSNKAGEVSGP